MASKTVALHTRISTSIKKELDSLAKKKGVSVASMQRDAIAEYIENDKISNKIDAVERLALRIEENLIELNGVVFELNRKLLD